MHVYSVEDVIVDTNAETTGTAVAVEGVAMDVVCLGVLTRMKERAPEVLACDAWAVDWATDSPVVS